MLYEFCLVLQYSNVFIFFLFFIGLVQKCNGVCLQLTIATYIDYRVIRHRFSLEIIIIPFDFIIYECYF